MRWFWWVVVMGSVGGCTVLNSDYVNEDASYSDGAGTSGPATDGGRPTGSGPAPTSDSDSAGTAPDDPTKPDTDPTDSHTDTSDPSGPGPGSNATTGAETGDWPEPSGGVSTGYASSDTGIAETGLVKEPVLLIYATTETFDFPAFTPEEACDLFQPDGTGACVNAIRYPLVTDGELGIPGALDALETAGLDVPVYGIQSDGGPPISEHPASMLSGLDVSLLDGGVNVEEDEEFWTGIGTNCQGWTLPKGFASVGSPTQTNATWYDVGEGSCGESYRILCACESLLSPF
jgi:hypothetical protein